MFPTITEKSRLPVHGFRWRTSGGEMVNPADMETRHVFYTWLLIWNHSCPEELVRPEGKRYDWFDPWYTPSRMLTAFGVMMVELKRRSDLRPDWARVVNEVVRSYAAWRGLDQLNELHQIFGGGEA